MQKNRLYFKSFVYQTMISYILRGLEYFFKLKHEKQKARSFIRFIRRVIVAGTIATLLFLLFDFGLMPWYVKRGGTIGVPLVVGLPMERAQQLLDSLNLQPREGEVRSSQEYPAGTVIAQNPVAGTVVKKGRRVYLSVSGGEQLVSVPNLRGKTLRDARFSLERSGLKIGAMYYIPTEEYPANTIVDQNVPPHSMVARGTTLSIVVSQGPSTDRVEVPDVIGRPLTEAGRILSNRGLKLGNINYQSTPLLLPNTVVEQFPRPGDLVEHGSTVDLFVARAVEKELPSEN